MSDSFEKIRHNNCTLYIRHSFLNHGLVQVLLASQDKWQGQYAFKTLPSSEHSRVHKFTISVDGVDRGVYVKQYPHKSILHFLKCLFFYGSPARQAFKAKTMLAENGFDVPEMVAVGECRTGFLHTKSFLATFGVENAKSLSQRVLETREILTNAQLINWREFIRDFGRTVGRMHAAGIFHGDLRLGNILVRREENSWRFFLIDNERTRKFGRLPFMCRLKNLVQLNMGPRGILSNTDLMRFFNEYRAENGMSREKGKALIAATLKKTGRRLDKETRIRVAMKRSLRTNYRYLRVEAGDLAAVFVRSFCHEAEPLDFLGKIGTLRKEGQILKDDRDCLVCRLKWNGRDIIVRQYKHKGFVFSLRDTAGKSHAKRDWFNEHRLRILNIPPPAALAFIERRRAGLVWESYFVSEYIEGHELDDFVRDNNVDRQEQWSYRKDVTQTKKRV